MSAELRVKAKTLMAEGGFINRERKLSIKKTEWIKKHYPHRQENLDQESQLRWRLHHHKHTVVGPEARATHLARNFLMGNPYRMVEKKNHPDRKGPDWDKVQRMVEKYGQGDARDLRQRLAEWKDEKAD